MGKINGRKYALSFYVIIVASVAWILPPVISALFMKEGSSPLVLMSAVEWISICSSTLVFYASSNLVGQHLDNQIVAKTDPPNSNSPSNEK
jgi:hypothetical protein